MQEEADGVLHARGAQHLAEQEEVVVLHPDDVVGPQERHQAGGEALVDAAVALFEAAVEVGQVEAVVQRRPQGAVGEACVELVIVHLRDVDRRGGDGVFLGELQRAVGALL